MNKIILMGRLTANPELRSSQNQASQVSYCRFSIAVDRKYKDASGQTPTDFINCIAWRNTAEFISKYFSKGNRILVTGSLQSRSYDDTDGKKRTLYEVNCEEAEFCERKQDSNYQSGNYPVPEPPPQYTRPAQDNQPYNNTNRAPADYSNQGTNQNDSELEEGFYSVEDDGSIPF